SVVPVTYTTGESPTTSMACRVPAGRSRRSPGPRSNVSRPTVTRTNPESTQRDSGKGWTCSGVRVLPTSDHQAVTMPSASRARRRVLSCRGPRAGFQRLTSGIGASVWPGVGGRQSRPELRRPHHHAPRKQHDRRRVEQVHPPCGHRHHERQHHPHDQRNDPEKHGKIHGSLLRFSLDGSRLTTWLDASAGRRTLSPGTESIIIEPTGSIVGPDTGAEV